jgi:hypothetical protein
MVGGKNMKRWLGILVLGFCAASGSAQVAIYGMGSAGKLSGYNSLYVTPQATNTAGSFWAYGGTIGIYDDFVRLGPLKFGTDARGFVQKNSSNSNNNYGTQLRGATAGLRLSGAFPLVPFKPYVQAELGGATSNFAQFPSRNGGIIYQVQVGGDFTVFPHLDLRAEYGAGKFFNVSEINADNNPTLQQMGVGAVIRF